MKKPREGREREKGCIEIGGTVMPISRYGKERVNIRWWLEEYERVGRIAGWGDEQKQLLFPSLLEGKAKVAYYCIKYGENAPKNWAEWKDKLTEIWDTTIE